LGRIAFALAAALTLTACAEQNDKPLESRLGADTQYGRGGRNGGYGHGHMNPAAAAAAFKNEVGDLVYFSSDSSDLTPEARQTLDAQAQWLAAEPGMMITIEGHADERGTREYNIALGARRATAVMSYLSGHGVAGSRIRTVSYGKERPVVVCNDISCWSKNRRAQTVLGSTAVSRN
jgi:peptidoglycan-associated lipoprotein